MGLKQLGIYAVTTAGLACTTMHTAKAQEFGQQNAYGGGTVANQDSIYGPSYQANRQAVLAAETNLNLSASYMHTQYHENALPGTGNDENGSTGGFSVGASVLLPNSLIGGYDFYSALDYDFSAGNLAYGGNLTTFGGGKILSTEPDNATDSAVFNRLEARVGVGFPIVGGGEMIPFLAGGYQSWNRDIKNPGTEGTDEFYDTALLGGGMKLDIPLTPRLVLSGTAEGLALISGNVQNNELGISHGLGGSFEERLSLGLDYALLDQLHIFGTADWEHFNYGGNKPTDSTYLAACGCAFYEPVSTTTQFGVNLGVSYSFYGM